VRTSVAARQGSWRTGVSPSAARHADQALNLFFAPDDIVGEDGSLDSRCAQFVLAVLERMLCDARRPELSNAERAVLGQAVEETYRRTAGRTPILSDLAGILAGQRGADAEEAALARGLARDLRIWVEGPAARLVNRPSTFALATDLASVTVPTGVARRGGALATPRSSSSSLCAMCSAVAFADRRTVSARPAGHRARIAHGSARGAGQIGHAGVGGTGGFVAASGCHADEHPEAQAHQRFPGRRCSWRFSRSRKRAITSVSSATRRRSGARVATALPLRTQ
jgi:hypothetical protein